ncbi:hypothetical protein [Lacticaseibacillus jixiensis]|uniref:hypothetical protein n=1 Tax=Lacticaseibacillus jixiensis TaxID=3231926 RepID=UPI0036F31A4C
MPVTKRYLIRDAQTNDMISYANLATTQRVLHHLLWQAYAAHVGLQQHTDPQSADTDDAQADEPTYLGAFEDYRETIRSNIDLWIRPDYWNYAMHYAAVRIYAVDPNRKFRKAFAPFKPWHEPEIAGPLPTDEPESDVDLTLVAFFEHEAIYMTQPDIPIGAILPDEAIDLFVDSWYQDHPEDWPDGDA